MDCKKVRDFVMMDYLDGEIKEDLRIEVKKHLDNCMECSEFETSFKNAVITPFRESSVINPPDKVWDNIKNSIESREGSFLERLRQSFRYALSFPRSTIAAVVLATAVILALVFSRVSFQNSATVDYLGEQMQFLSYLDNGDLEDMSFDTAIEKYFM